MGMSVTTPLKPPGPFRRLLAAPAGFVCGLSLLLCVLVCLLWGWSYRAGGTTAAFLHDGRRYEAAAGGPGVLSVTRIDGLPQPYVTHVGQGTFDTTATTTAGRLGVDVTRGPYLVAVPFTPANYYLSSGSTIGAMPAYGTGTLTVGGGGMLWPPNAPVSLSGYSSMLFAPTGTAVRATIPFRLPAAALALPPAAWLGVRLSRAGRRHRRRRRARAGRCADCGYDLRGSPEKGGSLLGRCPECGRPAASMGA